MKPISAEKTISAKWRTPIRCCAATVSDAFRNAHAERWKNPCNRILSISAAPTGKRTCSSRSGRQAEDGKVPVTGAGYRGPFTGAGFDSMWTDMSEIVRPTRDGIHGREYISTGVELGRKHNHLAFDAEGRLLTQPHPTVDIPIPILFDIPPVELSPNVMLALIKAASQISTCVILRRRILSQS